jgi:hypothetical protein
MVPNRGVIIISSIRIPAERWYGAPVGACASEYPNGMITYCSAKKLAGMHNSGLCFSSYRSVVPIRLVPHRRLE